MNLAANKEAGTSRRGEKVYLHVASGSCLRAVITVVHVSCDFFGDGHFSDLFVGHHDLVEQDTVLCGNARSRAGMTTRPSYASPMQAACIECITDPNASNARSCASSLQTPQITKETSHAKSAQCNRDSSGKRALKFAHSIVPKPSTVTLFVGKNHPYCPTKPQTLLGRRFSSEP